MTVYRPPTRVVTTSIPYLAMVNAADPDFQRRKYREVEYEFQGKPFLANPYVRGAYAGNLLGSVWGGSANAGVTLTSAAGAGPDGQRNATQVTESADGSPTSHQWTQSIAKTAEPQTYALSVDAKWAGRNLQMMIANSDFSDGVYAGFDTQSGRIIHDPLPFIDGSNFIIGGFFVQRQSLGYLRGILIVTTDSDTVVAPLLKLFNYDGDGANTYIGDGASGIFFTSASLLKMN